MNSKETGNRRTEDQGLPLCIICSTHLSLKLAKGRKSGKPFVMLACSQDGRHFRAFISHRPYVQQILERLENLNNPGEHA